MEDLRSIRRKLGLRIEDLAGGVCRPATISDIENARVIPNTETRKRIESVIGPVNWLSGVYARFKTYDPIHGEIRDYIESAKTAKDRQNRLHDLKILIDGYIKLEDKK